MINIPYWLKSKIDVLIVATTLLDYNVKDRWDNESLDERIEIYSLSISFVTKVYFRIEFVFQDGGFLYMQYNNLFISYGTKGMSTEKKEDKMLSECHTKRELDWIYNWIVNN